MINPIKYKGNELKYLENAVVLNVKTIQSNFNESANWL